MKAGMDSLLWLILVLIAFVALHWGIHRLGLI